MEVIVSGGKMMYPTTSWNQISEQKEWTDIKMETYW